MGKIRQNRNRIAYCLWFLRVDATVSVYVWY
jgi:hypothetical protein